MHTETGSGQTCRMVGFATLTAILRGLPRIADLWRTEFETRAACLNGYQLPLLVGNGFDAMISPLAS